MAIIRRLAWFAGLWAAGVAAVGIVGLAIRLALHQ
jgi:preprotein translocase subunit Sss1